MKVLIMIFLSPSDTSDLLGMTTTVIVFSKPCIISKARQIVCSLFNDAFSASQTI
jgi:hypothetical protein